VIEIGDALDLQAAALADGDFERVAHLAELTASLSDELLLAAAGLDESGRAAVTGLLARAVERASELCQVTEERRAETRDEIRDLRAGQSATVAYRQALPREAALHYSRQG